VPRWILLIEASGAGGAARTIAATSAMLAQLRSGGIGGPETHVVAVGGGAEVAEALRKAAPSVQPVAMGFHHLDDEGQLAHVKGKALDLLDRAAVRVRASDAARAEPGPTRLRIAQALKRGQTLARQEVAVANRLSGRYRVTAAITVACLAMGGMSYIAGSAMHDFALWRLGANNVTAVARGEVWRLFAAAFLHGDVIHLIVNMIALWSFGPLLEALFGPRRYLLLYAASALGGSLASVLGGPDRWSVGASGAIWGLMTAAIGIAVRPRGLLPQGVIAGMRSRVWLPLVMNVVYSLRPGIDMLGHLGGGVVGFVLAATVLSHGVRPVTERDDPDDVELGTGSAVRAGAFVATAVMAASVLAGIVLGRPWELSGAPTMRRVAVPSAHVSIEVPALIADQVTIERRGQIEVAGFGQLSSSPVAIEVLAVPLEGELTPQQIDEFLEHERRSLDEESPEGAVRRGPARRVTIGSHRGAVVEHDLKGVALTTYIVVVGTREILVRGYARKERPTTWIGLEEKVAASIRLE
jgi:membrane associated rhomboid family serine protease